MSYIFVNLTKKYNNDSLNQVNKHIKEREIKGLLLACEYLKVKKGTIVTYEDNEIIKINYINIEVVPAYRYILEVLSKKAALQGNR